jgi:hypothetical protein
MIFLIKVDGREMLVTAETPTEIKLHFDKPIEVREATCKDCCHFWICGLVYNIPCPKIRFKKYFLNPRINNLKTDIPKIKGGS